MRKHHALAALSASLLVALVFLVAWNIQNLSNFLTAYVGGSSDAGQTFSPLLSTIPLSTSDCNAISDGLLSAAAYRNPDNLTSVWDRLLPEERNSFVDQCGKHVNSSDSCMILRLKLLIAGSAQPDVELALENAHCQEGSSSSLNSSVEVSSSSSSSPIISSSSSSKGAQSSVIENVVSSGPGKTETGYLRVFGGKPIWSSRSNALVFPASQSGCNLDVTLATISANRAWDPSWNIQYPSEQLLHVAQASFVSRMTQAISASVDQCAACGELKSQMSRSYPFLSTIDSVPASNVSALFHAMVFRQILASGCFESAMRNMTDTTPLIPPSASLPPQSSSGSGSVSSVSSSISSSSSITSTSSSSSNKKKKGSKKKKTNMQ